MVKWCLFNCLCPCGLEVSCFCCEGRCGIVCNGFCEWPFQLAAGIAHPIPLPAKGALGLFCYLSPGLNLLRKESFPFKQSGEFKVSPKCYEVFALRERSASLELSFSTSHCILSGKTSEETHEWLCNTMLRNSPAKEYWCSTPFWNE